MKQHEKGRSPSSYSLRAAVLDALTHEEQIPSPEEAAEQSADRAREKIRKRRASDLKMTHNA
jgi:hypothetical protein